MKILIINKFLHPNGGSETYIFKLGTYLKEHGHQIEYFGMNHENRLVGNGVNSYTENLDFHTGNFSMLKYPFKIIYSVEARKKLRTVLDDFNPDVIHLNNFNFQLTPSIFYEIKNYEKATKQKINVIFTAHDYQLICPNHMMHNPKKKQNCDKCLGGKFINCIKGNCIHGSIVKSTLGSLEGIIYRILKTYKNIDQIICPSLFMENKMISNPVFANKTIMLHNFIDEVHWKDVEKEDYVLYFGRFSEEKGIKTLINVCKTLPNIQFIFAGTGPLENELEGVPNIRNVGFKTGDDLELIIRKAQFSIYPSEWYENCPFSVMESQMYGTPVLGADIGGIPELIDCNRTGELFRSSDEESMRSAIIKLWNDKQLLTQYSLNCKNIKFSTIDEYCEKLIKVYSGNDK